MDKRIRTFPYEVLIIWERHHGHLTTEQSFQFLKDPIIGTLGEFPNQVVDRAIGRTPKLSKALEFARGSHPTRQPTNPQRKPGVANRPDSRADARERLAGRKRKIASRLSINSRWRKGGNVVRRTQVWADENREYPTEAEGRLEVILKRIFPQTGAVQVQWIFGKPSAPYIFDFFIPAVRLGIEVDGSIHNIPDVKTKDEAKAVMAQSIGITLRRISNEQVLNSTKDAIDNLIRDWYRDAAQHAQSWERRPR